MRLTSRVRLASAYPWNSHASTMWSASAPHCANETPELKLAAANHRSAEAQDMDLDTRSLRTLS